MAKLFPESVSIKKHNCPTCKQPLEYPKLSENEAVIRALCVKDDCGFTLDLCWVGDLKSHAN